MQVVFKYLLFVIPGQSLLRLPKGAEILTAQFVRGELCLYALVPKDPLEYTNHQVTIVGTGQALATPPGRYLTTIQEIDGQLVWHLFIADEP